MNIRKVVSIALATLVLASTLTVLPHRSAEVRAAMQLSSLSIFASTPPDMDGEISAGEWDSAAGISLTHGHMLFQNDAANLYLLLDVTGDTDQDLTDFFWLSFDVDANGSITPNVDVNYATYLGTYDLGIQYYLGPNEWTGDSVSDSQLGAGFGSSMNSQTPHRIWELAISLPEIGSVPRDTVRLGLRVGSQEPEFTEDYPQGFANDFSNLVEIGLATAQIDLLVLAHEDFCDALIPLKQHKDYTGISTYIQSWQSIDMSYANVGWDVQERLKKAVADYEQYCDTKYVMLVGDCDAFPVRYVKAYNTEWGTKYYPSDLYYADLYRSDESFDNWDGGDPPYGGNHIFGEMDFTGFNPCDLNKLNLDRIDRYPDVSVGRVPASTASEVTTYVNKVIRYEFAAYQSDWFNRALWVVDGGAGAFGSPAKKDRLDSYLTANGFTITKRYQGYAPWDNLTYEARAADINGLLNDGMGFVNYYGHGNRLQWAGVYDSSKIWGGAFSANEKWHDYFCVANETPGVGDFNGDGKADVVSFVRDARPEPEMGDVWVALSTGSSFGSGAKWHDYFCVGDQVPGVGDFDGDGKDDLIAFDGPAGNGLVWVARSTDSGFGTAELWHGGFNYGDQVPLVGDFNGDGRDDIATFVRDTAAEPDRGDVYVSLSTGSGFGPRTKWHDFFCIGQEVPGIGDFDGDGKDDIVTFVRDTKADSGRGDVYVALSMGSSFGPSMKWHDFFCIGQEVPDVGDFNGDGKDDVATFIRGTKTDAGRGDVYVAPSTGSAFGTSPKWHDDFCTVNEWPAVGDFDGDGIEDIAAFVRDTQAGLDCADVDVAKAVPLLNTDKLPVVFAVSCYTGRFHFDLEYYRDVNDNEWNGGSTNRPEPMAVQPPIHDKESLAEEFLVKRDTGGIAYVGCTSKNEYGGEDLDKYFFEAYSVGYKPPTLGYMWNYALTQWLEKFNQCSYYAYLHMHKVMLFGDPSLRVGGVSRIQKKDFLGTYDMNHDGWKGTLQLVGLRDDPIEGLPNIGGTWTGVGGDVHGVRGYVRTSTYYLPPEWGPDWHIRLYIDFPDTPNEYSDDSYFEGYLFTGLKDAIAGISWWNNMPFGFYALKRTGASPISAAAPSVEASGLVKADFLGTYNMNHDGWKGTLQLVALSDDPIEQLPNIGGIWTGVGGDTHFVHAYVRTSTYALPSEWGPDWHIKLYIDFPDTPYDYSDDSYFEGYLFTGLKDAIAGISWWNNMPFGFYALKTIPPVVASGPATSIGMTSATLNGNLTSLGTASLVQVSFEWGLTTSYGNTTTPQTMTGTGAFNADISGLIPGTTYHFRAKVAGDSTAHGDDLTFATLSGTPPEATSFVATVIGTISATLNGCLTSLGTASSVQVSFEWGLTAGHGNTTIPKSMTGTGAFNADISGLTPGTTYHFRAKVAGDGTAYGDDLSFETDTTPPGVTTNDVSNLSTVSARLNGNLTSMGTASSVTVSFAWGTSSGSLTNEATAQAMTSTGAFYFDLASLTPGTTYYYKAKAVGHDALVYGVEKSFATGRSPELESVDPVEGKRKQNLTVTIIGANLNGATAVDFGSGITVEDFTVVSSIEITAEITIDAKATIGTRDVLVTTGWGTGTKTDGFEVVGSGGGVCSGGALATPGAPSEMTTTLVALGLLLGVGYLLARRGTRNRRVGVQA